MRIIDRLLLLDQRDPESDSVRFAFEFYPCKTREQTEELYDTLRTYKMLEPAFCDVSWGQRGQTIDKSLEIAEAVQTIVGMETQLHMTCTCYPEEQVRAALQRAKEAGIRNVLALRGAEQSDPRATFRHAVDLVRYIRKTYGDHFGISVAGYPGGHAGVSYEEDLHHLREKVEAGADLIITPMCYDPDLYQKFIHDCRANGILCPIFAGVMPIQDYEQWTNMVRRANTTVPESVRQRLEAVKHDPQAVMEYGIEATVQYCRQLMQRGVRYFYMYTMDNTRSVPAILSRLKWAPESPARPFPWESSFTGTRFRETVRPIYWQHRPYSYCTRTRHWHASHMPFGMWGGGQSTRPEFLPLSNHYLCNHYVPGTAFDRLMAWHPNPTTVADLQAVFLHYLVPAEGSADAYPCPALPWIPHRRPLIPASLLPALTALVRAGFFVINWQAAAHGISSSDAVVGWGPANGVVFQKAYLEFFCPKSEAEALRKRLAAAPLLTYSMIDVTGEDFYTNLHHPSTVNFGCFPGVEIIGASVVDNSSFFSWAEEAFSLWLTEWAAVYAADSPSHRLLQSMHDDYVLVSIVDEQLTAPADAATGSLQRIYEVVLPST